MDITLGQSSIVGLGTVALVALLGLSAFFSSAEIAMFSIADHRIESLRSERGPGAEILAKLKRSPHRLLVTILVGNNLVNIAMSSIATALVGFYAAPGTSVLVATFGITSLVLLFGESVPKSYAIEHSESWAVRTAPSVNYSRIVLLPLVVVFDYLTRGINRITGGRSAIETAHVTRDEVRELIEAGNREGSIREQELKMLQRIFRLSDTVAKEVMTPRLDVEAVSRDATTEEAIERCVQSGYDTVPVYKGNLDNVVGVVSIHELVTAADSHESGESVLSDIYRSAVHVPESKNVDELLREIRDRHVESCVVHNEFGTTAGILTTQDIVEAVVGDLPERNDEHPVKVVGEDMVVVRGEVTIDEVNETLDIELPEEANFETLAGFIFNRAGRLVGEGETMTYENVEIRAEKVVNSRILEARVSVVDSPDPPERPGDQDTHANGESTGVRS